MGRGFGGGYLLRIFGPKFLIWIRELTGVGLLVGRADSGSGGAYHTIRLSVFNLFFAEKLKARQSL
jgi:hypothetical protein